MNRMAGIALTCALTVLACSARAAAAPPDHQWSRAYGDGADQSLFAAAAIASSGEVVVSGGFRGSIDFGGGSLASAGGTDVYLAKLDTFGNHVWSERFGDGSSQSASALAIDASGAIYVLGTFWGTLDLGDGPLLSSGLNDAFLARFDSDGACMWSHSLGGSSLDYGRSVSTDADGNVYVVVAIYDTIDFGGGVLASAGDSDIAIAMFDSMGVHQWSASFGDAAEQSVQSCIAGSSGALLVTGSFRGSVDFGGGSLSSAGIRDVFVASFDTWGTHQWSRRFGGPGNDEGLSVTSDPSGQVLLGGAFGQSIDFGGGTHIGPGGFVVRLDASGGYGWSRSFGTGQAPASLNVTTDSEGGVLVGGSFSGTVNLGGDDLTSAGGLDILAARLGADGSHDWSRRYGDEADEAAEVVLSPSGSIYLAGGFYGALDLGGPTLVSAGLADVFVARFDTGPVSVPLGGRATGGGLITAIPNPFRRQVVVSFDGQTDDRAPIEVFDVTGRRVASVAGIPTGGRTAATWNGTHGDGSAAASGVYLLRLRDDNRIRTCKVILRR